MITIHDDEASNSQDAGYVIRMKQYPNNVITVSQDMMKNQSM